jgi:hypothetical protein
MDKKAGIRISNIDLIVKDPPKIKHSVTIDSKEQYWVYCPKNEENLPLAAEPKHCPMCGDEL